MAGRTKTVWQDPGLTWKVTLRGECRPQPLQSDSDGLVTQAPETLRCQALDEPPQPNRPADGRLHRCHLLSPSSVRLIALKPTTMSPS